MAHKNLRPLEPTDETTVKAWLRPYLTEHLTWWTAAYETAPRYSLDALVNREWDDLLGTSRAAGGFVGVAEAAEPLGVVSATLREDRYMGVPVGVLSWLYVAEGARGTGVSSLLMDAADAWMGAQGVLGREVFVTSENVAAVRLYERFGYKVVDARMLGPAPRGNAP